MLPPSTASQKSQVWQLVCSLEFINVKGCDHKGLQFLAAHWVSVMLTYLINKCI